MDYYKQAILFSFYDTIEIEIPPKNKKKDTGLINTINSEIIALIHNCDLEISPQNVRLINVILTKSACKFS